ncbi:MAG: hypothetical protein HY735_12690 [Verrucomicrobia bacterium]|nr:hypothetical protein [Verrucomicrobiota bacterium]
MRNAMQPRLPEAGVFAHLAEVRFHFEDAAGAERLPRQGLAAWPNSAELHDLLGGLCWRSGRKEEARRHNAQALRLDRCNPLFEEHRKQVMGEVQ